MGSESQTRLKAPSPHRPPTLQDKWQEEHSPPLNFLVLDYYLEKLMAWRYPEPVLFGTSSEKAYCFFPFFFPNHSICNTSSCAGTPWSTCFAARLRRTCRCVGQLQSGLHQSCLHLQSGAEQGFLPCCANLACSHTLSEEHSFSKKKKRYAFYVKFWLGVLWRLYKCGIPEGGPACGSFQVTCATPGSGSPFI